MWSRRLSRQGMGASGTVGQWRLQRLAALWRPAGSSQPTIEEGAHTLTLGLGALSQWVLHRPSQHPNNSKSAASPCRLRALGHQVLHHVVAVLVVAQLQRRAQHVWKGIGQGAEQEQVSAGRDLPATARLQSGGAQAAWRSPPVHHHPNRRHRRPVKPHLRSLGRAAQRWSRTRARAAPGGSQRCGWTGPAPGTQWSADVGGGGVGGKGWRRGL